mgnify:CR=1 FL=1
MHRPREEIPFYRVSPSKAEVSVGKRPTDPRPYLLYSIYRKNEEVSDD